MTIISASYRTDIPAFYGDWLMARLDAARAATRNPWTGRRREVSLAPGDVDGFVFWTRNIAPFACGLERVAASWPVVVQFTVTGYPRALDRSVIDAGRAVAQIRGLARAYGPRAVVWRYDPIVLTNLTDGPWHRENFRRLAGRLAGATDEAVVSFVAPYAKTRRNMAAAERTEGFHWRQPERAEKSDLLHELAAIAASSGMRLTTCAQPDLTDAEIAPAACIDPARLFGADPPRRFARSKNRPGCLCAAAVDIGQYDTCPHGCVYCYAVGSVARAKANHGAHDAHGALLAGP